MGYWQLEQSERGCRLVGAVPGQAPVPPTARPHARSQGPKLPTLLRRRCCLALYLCPPATCNVPDFFWLLPGKIVSHLVWTCPDNTHHIRVFSVAPSPSPSAERQSTPLCRRISATPFPPPTIATSIYLPTSAQPDDGASLSALPQAQGSNCVRDLAGLPPRRVSDPRQFLVPLFLRAYANVVPCHSSLKPRSYNVSSDDNTSRHDPSSRSTVSLVGAPVGRRAPP